MRTHFAVRPPYDMTKQAACGQKGKYVRLDDNAFRTDCLKCQDTDAHILALDEAKSERHKAFMAQPGKTVMEPWQPGKFMLCKSCGNGMFRHGERTCHGHYDNWHCVNCGNVESRLTETGMCF